MKIKPIETIYEGYRFRSRLEARWAVFFNALGIEWKYENEGYDIENVGWYLPDFEVKTKTSEKWFIEVKGNYDDETGYLKARALDKYPPANFMGVLIFGELNYAEVKYFPNDAPDRNTAALHALFLGVSIKDFNRAITIGRSARFEHGEKPPCKY